MATVFDVARYVLDKAGAMTTMKAEKLVYYCQAWSLAWDGMPLFDEDFQAWGNGPVCPALFQSHKGIFWLPEDYYDSCGRMDIFSAAQLETMDAVLKAYGDKEPQWLSELTHMERPWRETRTGVALGEKCERIIEKDLMQEYYGGLEDAQELC